jgi:hypothetical protein
MADMIDYLRKPVRAVIRNLAILPSVDPNRLLPLGGTTGQFPMKASDEDGDIVWADFQVDDELSLDSEFPVQNKVLASEIHQLQSQLDGIPFPSSDDPLMDGEADPGESPDFARADHVHPSDTSKANVEDVPTKTSDLNNDSGFITAADVPEEVFWATYGTTTKAEIETALANNLFVCCKYNSAVYFLSDRFVQGASIFTYTFVGMTTTDGLYIGPQIKYLKLVYKTADGGTNTWSNGTRIVPDLATDTPSALGTAAVGTSKKVARSDHVHSMPTAADVGAIADPGSGTTGQVLKKTVNGTEWANESGGGTTEIFIATYGTTTNAQIETAYSAGKMVFAVDSSDNVAILEEITTGEDYALFTSYHNSNMVVWQCENDTWTSSSKLIPSAYTSNPAMDGTASAGSSASYAKGDHVHPSDTSKIDMPSGGSTGQVLKKTANGVEWANESGGGGTTEVFWATYGTTTNAQIETAYTAGKVVLVEHNDMIATLTIISVGDDFAEFCAAYGNFLYTISCESDSWSTTYKHISPDKTTNASTGAVTQALDAEHVYHFTGALTSLTITLNAASGGDLAHYHFCFQSGSTAPTLTLPNTVVMPSGFQVEANKYYEIDILDGYGVAQSW